MRVCVCVEGKKMKNDTQCAFSCFQLSFSYTHLHRVLKFKLLFHCEEEIKALRVIFFKFLGILRIQD